MDKFGVIMGFVHEKILLDTSEKIELINITDEIKNIVRHYLVGEGLVNISTRHTTSAIVINENEEGLKKDIISILGSIVPEGNYCHDRIDNNARSHLMSLFLNGNQTLPVVDGRLNLGTWQSVFFVELDGGRHGRTVDVTVLF